MVDDCLARFIGYPASYRHTHLLWMAHCWAVDMHSYSLFISLSFLQKIKQFYSKRQNRQALTTEKGLGMI